MTGKSHVVIIYIAVFMAFLLAGCGKELHRSISVDQVESVMMWGEGSSQRQAHEAEVKAIVGWFNSATDIRENKDFAGTTPGSGIIIRLKSGKSVNILASGRDFEIQRQDVAPKNVSYWARQKDIKSLLEALEEQKKSSDVHIRNGNGENVIRDEILAMELIKAVEDRKRILPSGAGCPFANRVSIVKNGETLKEFRMSSDDCPTVLKADGKTALEIPEELFQRVEKAMQAQGNSMGGSRAMKK